MMTYKSIVHSYKDIKALQPSSFKGRSVLNQQRGVALIMALLIVALVTTISVEVSWRFDLDLARSGNRWHGMQAQSYMIGGENLAKVILTQDLEDTESQADHLQEAWATTDAQFPTEEGYISAKLEDAQGRLNVNLLGKAYNQTERGAALVGPQKYSESQRRFIRLLQTVDLGEGAFLDVVSSEAILDAVKDWIDADAQVTFPNGAEADYYSQLEPELTPANGPMASISELQVIQGMNPILYQGILPYVIALPGEGAVTNFNTIGLNFARSLNEEDVLLPLSIEQGQAIINDIAANPVESVEDITALSSIDAIFGVGEDNRSRMKTDDLTVSSNYFLYFGEVAVGDHIKRGKSLLFRGGGEEVLTLRRTDSNF